MIIYKITNTINNKVLIGQTTTRPSIRWRNHLRELHDGRHCNSHFQNAYIKYGKDAFIFEIIAYANSIDELNTLEETFISKYDSMNPRKGYNKLSGGKNFKSSAEFKETHRLRMLKLYSSGWQHPMSGKKHTDKSKKLMSISHKKYWSIHPHHSSGQPQSDASKLKKSMAWDKKNISRTFISPTGELHTVVNLRRFCKEYKLAPKAMRCVFNGTSKQHKGWKKAL